jgi:hypothetical protein
MSAMSEYARPLSNEKIRIEVKNNNNKKETQTVNKNITDINKSIK